MISADLVLIICLGLGFVGGVIRGWRRCLVGILVLATISLVLYFGFFDYAASWVQYDSLQFLSETFGFSLTYPVEELGITIRLTNVKDAFLLLQNVGLNPVLLNATSEGFTKATIGFVGFLVVIIISFLLSTLLYWVLLRWIMPKRIRKGILSRIIGAALGMVEMGAICLVILQFSGNLAVPIDQIIVPQLQDSNSELMKLLSSMSVTQGNVETIVSTIQSVTNVLNPLSENSTFTKALFENLNNMGLSPFNIISVDVIDENGEKVAIQFKDAFTDMLDDFVETGIGKLNTLLGA